MRVVVIGLGQQQPADAFKSGLMVGPIVARDRSLAAQWLGGTAGDIMDLGVIFNENDVASIPAQFLSAFQDFERHEDAVTYLVPESGQLGDETVRLLGERYPLEILSGSFAIDPPASNATVVDALSLSLAEESFPFDAGRAALSLQSDVIVTNFTGAQVRRLAGRRLNRTYGYIAEPSRQGTLRYAAAPETAPSTSFDGLERIVSILRSPDGCPWDREQTIESLLPQLAEELDEFREALAVRDHEDQADELGDVLLHIVMISQIARESGAFEMGGVVQAITAKMIRRHPHVFGDVEINDVEDLYRIWNDVKKQEQLQKNRTP